MRRTASGEGGAAGGGGDGRPGRAGLRLSAGRRDGGALRLHQVPPALPLRGAQPGPAALQGPGRSARALGEGDGDRGVSVRELPGVWGGQGPAGGLFVRGGRQGAFWRGPGGV